MTVVCIINDFRNLTIGKKYEVLNIGKVELNNGHTYISYEMINDKNLLMFYPIYLFITIEEYRNKKLEELGI